MKRIIVVALALVFCFAVGTASAEGLNIDMTKVYAGGGLAISTMDDATGDMSSATGYQIFGGYELPYTLGPAKTAVEVGYMNQGEYEYTTPSYSFFGTTVGGTKVKIDGPAGLWATAVALYPVAPQINIIGRLGLDFGDDDGLIIGVGAGYEVNKQIQVRAEYVKRANTTSMELNAAYHF